MDTLTGNTASLIYTMDTLLATHLTHLYHGHPCLLVTQPHSTTHTHIYITYIIYMVCAPCLPYSPRRCAAAHHVLALALQDFTPPPALVEVHEDEQVAPLERQGWMAHRDVPECTVDILNGVIVRRHLPPDQRLRSSGYPPIHTCQNEIPLSLWL
jgi:hypothetical protein